MIFNKHIINYLLKFIICYCILYYGTQGVIGLTSPGGYYSPFIHDHLNYIVWVRFTLLYCSKLLLAVLGYHTFIDHIYTLRIYGGHGVHIVYSCLGFGVMSFWIAFIFANKTSWQKKIRWGIAGVVSIFFINILRISLLLIAVNNNGANALHVDNHLLFNIAAYILIFTMIYLFDRSEKKSSSDKTRG